MKTGILISTIVLGLPAKSLAQIGQCFPEKPHWGDTLSVSYDPSAESSKFNPKDTVYVVYFAYWNDKTETLWEPTRMQNRKFVARIPVEPDMASLQFYFVTMEGWDQGAFCSTMIYRPDGVPARRAFQNRMWADPGSKKYLEYFKQERDLYPDNYSVYRDKWVRDQMESDTKQSIEADLKALLHVKEASPDLLYALSIGYLRLGDEAKGREYLMKLAVDLPKSVLTLNCIIEYEQLMWSKVITNDGQDSIKALSRRLAQEFPLSALVRDRADRFVDDMSMSIEDIEAICRPWIQEQPDNPKSYWILSRSYFKRKTKLEAAKPLIERAIELFLRGKARLYFDISGKTTGLELPYAFHLHAMICFELNEYSAALASIKAGESLTDLTFPQLAMTEASVWKAISHYDKAEKAYLRAIDQGEKSANDSLKIMYVRRKGSEAGFDEYLAKKRETKTTSANLGGKPIPQFDVTTLAGARYKSGQLKGKVVVFNFWFTACTPCKVEIPGLNKIVDQFKNKNVIFLACATDNASQLTRFLKKTPFKYEIVPEAYAATKTFDVSVFPTHVILNQKGEIAFKFVGGGENRDKDLTPLIESLLR